MYRNSFMCTRIRAYVYIYIYTSYTYTYDEYISVHVPFERHAYSIIQMGIYNISDQMKVQISPKTAQLDTPEF